MDELSSFVDATAAAAQLGRLDLVSLLLAAIGLILVAGGVYAFINFRKIAREQATEEAKKTAEEVAELIVNEYLQRELPGVIEAHLKMMQPENLSDEEADGVANSQEDQAGGHR